MKTNARFAWPVVNSSHYYSITELGRRAQKVENGTWRIGFASFPIAPYKTYFEISPISTGSSSGPFGGVARSSAVNYPGYDTAGVGWYFYSDGNVKRYYNAASTNVSTWSAGANDVFGIAFDPTTGKIWIAKNNSWIGSGDPVNGTNPQLTLSTGYVYYPSMSCNQTSDSVRFNFCAADFKYSPPDGFFAYGDASVGDYAKGLSLSPAAIWPLNETAGTTINELLNTLNGTASGTPSLNQLGVALEATATAIQFDGTDDYIEFPDSIFNSSRMGSSWSVDFFVKVISAETDDAILYAGSTTNNKSDQIAIVAGPTGDRYLKVLFNDSGNGALTSLVASAASLGTGGSWGKWLHVALVKSGTDTCTLYVNGAQMDSQSIVGFPTVARTVFRIARDEGSNYANILVSSLAFYESALSLSAVKRHYWAGIHYNTWNSFTCLGLTSPIGYWKLSEPTGTTIYDLTKNERDGTLYGTVTYSQTGGILADADKSLQFDGNTACIEFADAAWNQLTSSLSISAWVKHDSTTPSADEGIFTKFVNDTGYANKRAYALVWQSDHKVRFYVSNNGSSVQSVVTTGALTVNTWYHIVAVYTAGSKLEIYINGSLNNNNSSSIPASLYASNAPVYIGNHYNLRATNSAQYYFSGYMQDVFLCNKALAAADVTAIYNSGAEETRATNGSLVTLSSTDKHANVTLTNSNFGAYSSGNWYSVRATLGRRYGKFYFEVICPPSADYVSMAWSAGLINSAHALDVFLSASVYYPHAIAGDNTGSESGWWVFKRGSGTKYYTPSNVNTDGTFGNRPMIITGFAVDFDTGKLWIAYNNTWVGSGDPVNGLNPISTDNIYGNKLFPALNPHSNGSYIYLIGLSQKTCFYSPPDGFSYWDQSGVDPSNVGVVRATRVALSIIYSSPPVPVIRVTRLALSSISQATNFNKRTGTHYWSRMMLEYFYSHSLYFRLYTHHLYVIVKQTIASNVYKLSGTVTLSGHPVSRYVRAHKMINGAVLGTTMSHPTTGYFEITTTYNLECYIIAFDDLSSPDLGSLLYDRVFPVQVT